MVDLPELRAALADARRKAAVAARAYGVLMDRHLVERNQARTELQEAENLAWRLQLQWDAVRRHAARENMP